MSSVFGPANTPVSDVPARRGRPLLRDEPLEHHWRTSLVFEAQPPSSEALTAFQSGGPWPHPNMTLRSVTLTTRAGDGSDLRFTLLDAALNIVYQHTFVITSFPDVQSQTVNIDVPAGVLIGRFEDVGDPALEFFWVMASITASRAR